MEIHKKECHKKLSHEAEKTVCGKGASMKMEYHQWKSDAWAGWNDGRTGIEVWLEKLNRKKLSTLCTEKLNIPPTFQPVHLIN